MLPLLSVCSLSSTTTTTTQNNSAARPCVAHSSHQPSAMSGGYHNSSVDSPGKKNTRAKYGSFSSVSSGPVVHLAPAINEPVFYQHAIPGGYYNRPIESPGKVSTRVKYSSVLSNTVYSAAPLVTHAPVFNLHNSSYVSYSYAPIAAHAHPVKGGYYNRPTESPGRCSSRVKYSSVIRIGAAHATGSSVSASKSANQSSTTGPSQAQIDAVKKQYISPHTETEPQTPF